MSCVNPYSERFNLTEAASQKRYEKATKGTKTKHDLTSNMEKAEEFLTSIKSNCCKFCLGPVTTRAEIQITSQNAGTDVIDILTDYSKVSKSRIIETAGVLWGCTFNVDDSHDF